MSKHNTLKIILIIIFSAGIIAFAVGLLVSCGMKKSMKGDTYKTSKIKAHKDDIHSYIICSSRFPGASRSFALD